MQICQDTLDDVDIKAISQLDTFDKLVAHLSLAYNEHADKTIPRILGEIKPSLKLLQKFSVAFVVFVHKATLATAAIWGLLNLLIEVWPATDQRKSGKISLTLTGIRSI